MERFKTQLESFYDSWRKIDVQYELYAKKHGLSYTALKVLYYIYRGNGACTQTIICEKTMLPKQTIHSVIHSFVKDGTLLLEENPENRKSKRLVLSGRGRDFCAELFETMYQREYEVMSQLSDEKRTELITLLCEYANAFEKVF